MALTHHGNFIYTKSNALPESLCTKLIDEFKKANDKKHGETIGGLQLDIKDSTDLWIGPNMTKWGTVWQQIDEQIHKAVAKTYSEYVRIHESLNNLQINDTGYQVQHYPQGIGRYHWHSDNLGGATQKRQLSMVMYLNDVDSGGETEFKYFDTKIKPEAGKILVFPPFWTHLHRGNVPLSDDKYIITTFFVLEGGE